MSDPFDLLRDEIVPVDPDPVFAAALRARLGRAVLDPGSETTMTVTTDRPATTTRLHTLTSHLRVLDSRAAVEFYVAAFGAVRLGEPVAREDGAVAHVEIAVGDSVLVLADTNPEYGLVSPVERGGPSASVRVQVPDAQAAFAAAVAAGATVERPVGDEPYGYGGVVLDPSGNRLVVVETAPAVRPGDLSYAALWVRDADRAARFFGAVLGWETASSHDGSGHMVSLPGGFHLGILPTTGSPTTFLCYAVADVGYVRAAGGTAGDVQRGSDGVRADCTDDQGVQFALNEATAGRPLGRGHGTLAYIERQAPDTGAARAFYGTVLGQRHLPGNHPGYWHPGPSTPVAGLTTGPGPVVVPGFTADDLDAGVTAVRAAGGRVDAVRPEGHGRVAACVDDQGFAFTLQDL